MPQTEAQKSWYLENKERVKQRAREYYSKNKEICLERMRIWTGKNREKSREIKKRWASKNCPPKNPRKPKLPRPPKVEKIPKPPKPPKEPRIKKEKVSQYKRLTGEPYKRKCARIYIRYHTRSGNIIKPEFCQDCGIIGLLQAHHHMGYEKENWGNVEWLCKPCHLLRHRIKSKSHQ